jgi:hypothetical protein
MHATGVSAACDGARSGCESAAGRPEEETDDSLAIRSSHTADSTDAFEMNRGGRGVVSARRYIVRPGVRC